MSQHVEEADQAGQCCAGTREDAVELLERQAGDESLVGACGK